LLISSSTILLATGNAHKADEMKAIITPLLPDSIILVTLKDVGLESPPDDIERYKTFTANARAKALWCAKQSQLPSIADDSGLCMDALDGAPGVRSARWAGPDATDKDRCQLLLAQLERAGSMSLEQRRATFVCACVFAIPGQTETVCRMGSVRGQILLGEDGSGGFGYDPLFLVPRLGVSMARLGPDTKNQISHRARALKSLATAMSRDMQ